MQYQGTQATTKSGRPCLVWSLMKVAYSEFVNETNFPFDASVEDAKNYCRNPSMDDNGPWCFTRVAGSIFMEACDACRNTGT